MNADLDLARQWVQKAHNDLLDADWMPRVEEAVEARQAAGSILTWFERALPEVLEA